MFSVLSSVCHLPRIIGKLAWLFKLCRVHHGGSQIISVAPFSPCVHLQCHVGHYGNGRYRLFPGASQPPHCPIGGWFARSAAPLPSATGNAVFSSYAAVSHLHDMCVCSYLTWLLVKECFVFLIKSNQFDKIALMHKHLHFGLSCIVTIFAWILHQNQGLFLMFKRSSLNILLAFCIRQCST